MTALILGFTGVFIHLLGAGFLWYYWTQKARAITRKWIRGFLSAAPMILLINIVQYVIMTWDLAEFPPATQGSCWGACMMFAIMLTIFAFLPLGFSVTIATKALDEDLVTARATLKEAEQDAAVEMRA